MKPEKERNRVANSVSSPFAPKKIFRQTNGPSYHSIILSHIFLKPSNEILIPLNCADFVVFLQDFAAGVQVFIVIIFS